MNTKQDLLNFISYRRQIEPTYFIINYNKVVYGIWREADWVYTFGAGGKWAWQLLDYPEADPTGKHNKIITDALIIMDKYPNFAGLSPKQFLQNLLK